MPTLPNVTSKFVFDYSDLTKAEKASAKAHGQFQSDAKASTTHNLRFEQSLTTMLDKFGGMPPVVNQAGRSIESMASQGVTGMGLLGGAAAAGLGIVVEVLKGAEEGYVGLADKVENYRRVVGGSAEDSSRMVETFQALGVSSETATQGMFKLSKAIESTPKKLADLGVETGRDAKGNIDLSKTLFNVADAYNAAGDQTKKNAILFTAFGKSGKDMIPILEQGSTALKDMAKAAGLVFTEDDLRRVREMKIHTEEAKQAWQEWLDQAGKPVVAAMDTLSTSELANAYATQKVSEMHLAGAATGDKLGTVHAALIAKFEAEWYASQKLKEGLLGQSAAAKTLAEDDAKVIAEADKLISAQRAQFDTGYALTQANLAVTESGDKITAAQIAQHAAMRAVTDAQTALNIAARDYGPSSKEAGLAQEALTNAQIAARKATDDVTRSQADQEKALYDSGTAAFKAQEAIDKLTVAGVNQELEAQTQIDVWQKEADALDPGSPLRKKLEGWIQDLYRVPTRVTSTLDLIIGNRPGTAHGNLSFAEGGRPPVGVPSWVGERGRELFVPDQPGTIVPHGATPPPAKAGNTYHTHLTLNGTPLVNDPDGVRRMLNRMQMLGAAD